MLIDWFTIIAQIINFIVLLLLLRRFLYRPILNAMQARTQQIAERLESAAQKQQEAEAERERYQALTKELHQYYSQKQREAEDEVETWRKQALQEARQEVDNAAQTWHAALEQEKAAFAAELRQFAIRQVYTVAGQALRDLADASLEEILVERFTHRLERGEIELDHFRKSAHQELRLNSAFPLPPEARQRLHKALQTQLGAEIPLEFATSPDLEAGIELTNSDGYQAAWNLKRYLQTLEDDLDLRLLRKQREEAHPHA